MRSDTCGLESRSAASAQVKTRAGAAMVAVEAVTTGDTLSAHLLMGS
jgi:hypothetical protein